MAKDWKGFERSIAKMLGEWWGCTFRRTPSSGAWSKQGQSRFSKGLDAAGDFHGDIVAPPEAHFPFSVECKCYKEVELYKALYGKSNVFDWWQQCLGDSKRVHKLGMLVVKENGKGPLVILSLSSYLKLKLADVHIPSIDLTRDHRHLFVYDLKLFLQEVPAGVVRRRLRIG
jgi:hypothetical protein